MATNEMQLAKAFRENAGLDQDKAERLATTIFDAIRDNVATKQDLDVLRQTIRGEIQLLKWMVGGVYALLVVFGAPALLLLLRVAAKVGALG